MKIEICHKAHQIPSLVCFPFAGQDLCSQSKILYYSDRVEQDKLTSYSLTTLMPRPPPPYAALKMMGKPYVWANACASFMLAMGESVPGTTGTPGHG